MQRIAIITLVLALASCSKPAAEEQALLNQQQSAAEQIDLKAAVRADNERELRERAARKSPAANKAQAAGDSGKP